MRMYVLLLAFTILAYPRTSTDIRNHYQPSAIMSNIPPQEETIPNLMEKLKHEMESYTKVAEKFETAIRTFIADKQKNKATRETQEAMRKMSIESLESLYKIQYDIRRLARAALDEAIHDAKERDGFVLPVYSAAFPKDMWEVAQTELDDYYKRRNIIIPPERRRMEHDRLIRDLFGKDAYGAEGRMQKDAKAFLLECFKQRDAQYEAA
jgi:hypothetical protein